jgi:hypothetical protein
MSKNLLGKALARIPVDPEDYVKRHYSELRKKYGNSLLAIKGFTAREGSIKVVAHGKDARYATILKRFESDAPLEGKVVVGTLEEIYKGKGKVVERKPFEPFEYEEEKLRPFCNSDPCLIQSINFRKSSVLDFRIGFNCSSVALRMVFNDLNSFIRAFAVTGPIFGKPSKIYWSCSCFDLKVIGCLREISLFFVRFARTER